MWEAACNLCWFFFALVLLHISNIPLSNCLSIFILTSSGFVVVSQVFFFWFFSSYVFYFLLPFIFMTVRFFFLPTILLSAAAGTICLCWSGFWHGLLRHLHTVSHTVRVFEVCGGNAIFITNETNSI